MKKLLAIVAVAFAFSAPAWSAGKSVTLSVPGMTCPACPITVKKALSRVDGVQQIEIRFKKREAVVTYDNAKVRIADLTRATKNAGYPSTVVH